MTAPSRVQKVLYLGGRRAPDDHRAWIEGILNGTPPAELGLLLALPNAIIVVLAAVALLAVGDTGFAAIFLLAAVGVLVIGRFVPAITRQRVKRIVRKNDLD